MPNITEIAYNIAKKAHLGQVDKAGVDYIQHPLTVSSFVEGDDAKAVAYLHDVLEDTTLTSDDLLNQGIPKNVVKSVEILTKDKCISYEEYLTQVKGNELAKIVKLADLKHNSDITRLNNITPEDIKRLEKYSQAIDFLSE